MTLPAGSPATPLPEKVVIQLGSRTIKGYLDCPAWGAVDDLLRHVPQASPEVFRVRLLESNRAEEIKAEEVKAIFFVNSFEGDSLHQQLNFYSSAAPAEGIWMRLEFLDGEVMEGLVYNSIRYLVDPGFFVLPTDPESNNRLVYVQKRWLADHRALGLRKL